MPVQDCIPFSPDGYITKLAGLRVGQQFFDPKNGEEYTLYQVGVTQTNGGLTDKEALAFSGVGIVTNVVAQQAAGGPAAAGVVKSGTKLIPHSVAGGTTVYALILTKGTQNVKGTGTPAVGGLLVTGTTAGAVDPLATGGALATPAPFLTIIGRTLGTISGGFVPCAVDVRK